VGVISLTGPYFHADGTCGLRYHIRRKEVDLTSGRVLRRCIEGLSDGTIARGIRIVNTSRRNCNGLCTNECIRAR